MGRCWKAEVREIYLESVGGIEEVLRASSKEERQGHGEAKISRETLKKEMAKLRERFQTGNEKKKGKHNGDLKLSA